MSNDLQSPLRVTLSWPYISVNNFNSVENALDCQNKRKYRTLESYSHLLAVIPQDPKMFDKLKIYCKTKVSLTEEELKLIDTYFEVKDLKKKDFLLQDGKVCNSIGFISNGTIRHFHIKDGVEKTCDISFENSWVTDFQSFTHNTSCIINLQAMEDTKVFIIKE
jgi:CRP-like cAMP-binding protein